MGWYLQVYCNDQQDNWSELLPLAEFPYNNTPSVTTGITPFFAIKGYHPNLTVHPEHDLALLHPVTPSWQYQLSPVTSDIFELIIMPTDTQSLLQSTPRYLSTCQHSLCPFASLQVISPGPWTVWTTLITPGQTLISSHQLPIGALGHPSPFQCSG